MQPARCMAYLVSEDLIKVVRPILATISHLLGYHEEEYVDNVLSAESDDSSNATPRVSLEKGLEGDCPPFSGLTTLLKQGRADIAINWDGGRHHTHKDHASGLCYVADCTLALLALKRPPKSRIMYIDLDLHFSDAVSQAFTGSSSGQILTLSIHHSAPGFFPISPLSTLPNTQMSDPYTLSIPLKRGASDKTFRRIWGIVESVKETFDPGYVVVQCGADGLAGDPCAIWNWSLGSSEGSFGWYITQILQWNIKTLLLGGGGYNSPNTARAWSYITALALGHSMSLDTDIPDHNAFPLYAPSFTLDVPAGNMVDENTHKYLEHVENIYDAIIQRIK
ncbi:hypothetical protein M422DRAFT_784786 [Sphaerobolus stellatus SS14]|uniref:histone deacetylase n=1 Tax=Sphaerobolus stellatus (strain SS14) TaxID=990650 RepID=A0A0C9UFB8_SPHS4|nr:hypothetical protein M422DRAFT_784786 [Sphaerobolus stellatus SS14]